jgi:hypothetical protein
MRHLLGRGLLVTNEGDRLLSRRRISGIDRVARLYTIRGELLGEEEVDEYEPCQDG